MTVPGVVSEIRDPATRQRFVLRLMFQFLNIQRYKSRSAVGTPSLPAVSLMSSLIIRMLELVRGLALRGSVPVPQLYLMFSGCQCCRMSWNSVTPLRPV